MHNRNVTSGNLIRFVQASPPKKRTPSPKKSPKRRTPTPK